MTRTTQLAIALSIFAVVVRLIAINQPYIDNWSWRQSDVAAMARNFYENGFRFAYPQIDWAGNQPGYAGTEFPILPFLAAVSYKFFGVHEWVGRVQAVILFAVSLPFFFLLVRDILGQKAAIWALFFYSLAPLSVMTSRCFMPDVPSLSFALIGLYLFKRWFGNERTCPERQPNGSTSLFTSAICISLSILIKAPSALIGAPLACLAFQRFGFSALRRSSLWIFAAIALLPSVIWYWHAHSIAQKFYPHHFFGAGGIQIMDAAWYGKIAKQVITSGLTPVLVGVAAIGAFVTRSRPQARLFHWWLAAMVLFIIVVGYGNRHQWYQLPLTPIAATFAGAGSAFIAAKVSDRRVAITLSILLAGLFGAMAFYYTQLFYASPAAQLRNAGLELKQVAPPNSLIVAADNGDPTIFYYAHRKGWHFLEKNGIYDGEAKDSPHAIVDLEALRRGGASYLVFTSNTSWWLDYYKEFAQHVDSTATLIETTPQFKIYKLNPVTE